MAEEAASAAAEAADTPKRPRRGQRARPAQESVVRPVIHERLEEAPYRIERLPLRDLHVDSAYQASVSVQHLRDMIDNWNPQLLIPIVANRRADGQVMVLDGRHRIEAMGIIHGPDSFVEAMLYDGMTVSEEAQLYYKLNTAVRRKTLRAIFHARLAAGEPTAVAIQQIVEDCGFHLSVNERKGTPLNGIRAVGGLDLFYRVGGPEHLRAMLKILRDAWGDHTEGETAVEVLWALHMLLMAHGGMFDRASLVERLKEEDPRRIIAAGRRFQYNKRMSQRGYYTYKALVEIYNLRKREENKLNVVSSIEEFRAVAKKTRESVPFPLGVVALEAVRAERAARGGKHS